MRREQDGDLMLTGDAVQQRHDLLDTTGVKIGEGLVEQQQRRLTDECVRDEDSLLFSSRETADASVRESIGVDVVQHLIDEVALFFRAA